MKLLFTFRSILMTGLFILITAFLSLCGVLNFLTLNHRKLHDFIISSWARLVCFIFNVKLRVHHPENIPHTGSVFLFNHSSFFDIFALAAVVPDIRFGAKVELFNIPLFGSAMKSAGTLPIARGSREEVFKVYSAARERIEKNEKFALSPEGGRFYGETLSPFKSGPFIFAITSGALIVPVIIKGAYEVLPMKKIWANSDRWSRTIDIYFLNPHSVRNYNNDNRQELQKVIYDQMNSKWISKN